MVFSKNNFLANNEKNGWDGTMNSTQLPPDVYIYVIELELGDGKIKIFSGDVTLIRWVIEGINAQKAYKTVVL